MSDPYLAEIYELIEDERLRQHDKFNEPHAWGFGDCSSHQVPPIVKAAVLTEECGEVARAVLDELDDTELIAELVQVAAVSIAWLSALI